MQSVEKDLNSEMSVRPNELPGQRQSRPIAVGFRAGARNLSRIFAYAKPYRGQLTLTMLALIATGAFAIATPLLLEWAINTALGAEGAASVDVNKTLVVVAAGALLGAALLRGLAQFVQAYLAEWVGQTVAYDVRNSLYERLQNLSFSYHDEAETGQIMARATQDVEVIRMFLNFGGVRLLFTMMLMSSILVIMLVKDWQLALAVWGFMIVIGWRSFRVSSGLRPVWQDVQEGQAQLGIVLQEALTGIRVVKAFAREPFEGAKFSRAATFLWERSFLASKIQAINMPLMTALWMGSLVATMWIGGVKVANGSMNVGELTSFLFFVQLLQMPIRSLGWMVMMVPRAATSSQRIFDILDEESEVLERPGARAPRNPRGHVRFSGVAFAYNEERPVLSEVEFEAKPGEVVALLGPTGSGKTTIVNLIPRFYDVTAGAVLLDGEDVRDLTLEGLRSQVAIVQQDVFLFAATIRDNIAYGRPDATDEEVRAAAQLARIHDHISTLPEGYNTWVGERGATLSGGQKQRMAIARALLMDPRVLIFDDSTSSVDSATEYEIQQAMSALMEGRTTFVIAHRLRSVKDADQILVLDESRIVQRGTHLELLAEGGLYREIYDLELRDQEEAFAQVAGGGS